MSVVLAPTFGVGYQAFDTNGKPLNAGQLFTYAAGTTSQIPSFTTNLGNVTQANPIVLGTDGRPATEIWLTLGTSYRVQLQDSLNNLIADYDNINTPSYSAITIVASATSGADIWSPAGPVSWTGTAVATGFAAAPVAGASKLLICNNVCGFTTSANLLIDGVDTGTTVWMNNGARVTVIALTTTQFQLQYELSGTFTATLNGVSTAGTATWYYNVNNGTVNLNAKANALGGTSNSSGASITGFVSAVTPNTNRIFTGIAGTNNGNQIGTIYGLLQAAGVMTLYTDPTGSTWSSVNSKTIYTANFTYQI